MDNLEKSSLIRITKEEYENFLSGIVSEKLASWMLTKDQFHTMIRTGQIIIEDV